VNLDLLERLILAERDRRRGEAIVRQSRRPGGSRGSSSIRVTTQNCNAS
jgi:hypothetical protein